MLDDGALSVMDDETGNTRYDLNLPSGDLSKDIKDRFEKQETLYVSDSCSTLSLQISAVICLIDCRYGVKPYTINQSINQPPDLIDEPRFTLVDIKDLIICTCPMYLTYTTIWLL